LYFIANGSALVLWTDTTILIDADSNVIIVPNTHTASEHYFTIKDDILDSFEPKSIIELKQGYHRYPFEFQLPRNIPSSFENVSGHIRYTVKAVIKRPWKFDHECKAAFTVVSTLDLNANRDKCIGINDEVQKKFYSCCCKYGSMNITIRLPSTGFVPGQLINTYVNFRTTLSQVPILKISTTLEQVSDIIKISKGYSRLRLSNGESLIEKPLRAVLTILIGYALCTVTLFLFLFKVAKLYAASATTFVNISNTSTTYSGPFLTHTPVNLEIRVPPIPPSNLSFCNIIDMDYYLKVIVYFRGAHVNLQRKYPLLIGSVPLHAAPREPPCIAKEPVASPPMPLPDAPQPGVSNTQPPHVGSIVPDQAGTSTNWDI
ncbi:arrestin domain-containing protein 3-like, partial [Augochlora pura]